MCAPYLHLDAVGIEALGEVDGRYEGFLVVDFEVVVDYHFQFVDVVELGLAAHDGALEVEHQLFHLVVEVCKAVVVHSYEL